MLLDAFKEIIKEHKNIKLVFIGSPPPGQEIFLDNLISKINKYLLQENVIHISFYDEIYKLWNAVDIAIVPSTEPEPFGLVAVEAMMAKKPVIGSNHGGLKEIIVNGETGFLVEPKDINALKSAVEQLIKNPSLRKSMGEKGYLRAIVEFSEEKYVAEILTVLDTF